MSSTRHTPAPRPTAGEVLSQALQAGVELARCGQSLRYRPTRGALATSLRRAIARHLVEILEFLPDRGRRFSDQEEALWRFGRMRRRVLAGGLPADLVVRPGLRRVPERCCSCGALFDSGPTEGRHCPPCVDAVAMVRQLHAEGRLGPAPVPDSAAAQARPLALRGAA